MTSKQIIPIALSLCLFISCKKSDEKIVLDGTYKGTFIAGPINKLVSVNTEIKFSGSEYFTTNGTGIFTVKHSKINFSMAYTASMNNVTTSVLNGDYKFAIKGDSLILDGITSETNYKNQYRLKRMK